MSAHALTPTLTVTAYVTDDATTHASLAVLHAVPTDFRCTANCSQKRVKWCQLERDDEKF